MSTRIGRRKNGMRIISDVVLLEEDFPFEVDLKSSSSLEAGGLIK